MNRQLRCFAFLTCEEHDGIVIQPRIERAMPLALTRASCVGGPRPHLRAGAGMEHDDGGSGPVYSAVVGSITARTWATRFAGKPPRRACSRTWSASAAM